MEARALVDQEALLPPEYNEESRTSWGSHRDGFNELLIETYAPEFSPPEDWENDLEEVGRDDDHLWVSMMAHDMWQSGSDLGTVQKIERMASEMLQTATSQNTARSRQRDIERAMGVWGRDRGSAPTATPNANGGSGQIGPQFGLPIPQSEPIFSSEHFQDRNASGMPSDTTSPSTSPDAPPVGSRNAPEPDQRIPDIDTSEQPQFDTRSVSTRSSAPSNHAQADILPAPASLRSPTLSEAEESNLETDQLPKTQSGESIGRLRTSASDSNFEWPEANRNSDNRLFAQSNNLEDIDDDGSEPQIAQVTEQHSSYPVELLPVESESGRMVVFNSPGRRTCVWRTAPAGSLNVEGVPFPDAGEIRTMTHISAIRVIWGGSIYGIQLEYNNRTWSTRWGVNSTDAESRESIFRLAEGEFIVEVKGRDGTGLYALQFITNTGRTSIVYGGNGGTAFSRDGFVYLLQPYWGSGTEELSAFHLRGMLGQLSNGWLIPAGPWHLMRMVA
ncbi:hypothetical protein FRB90_000966 [Tulasnella sp. 427]|nr:hypothetical protein FRB90_000966 [Tulasnella sp. 427]